MSTDLDLLTEEFYFLQDKFENLTNVLNLAHKLKTNAKDINNILTVVNGMYIYEYTCTSRLPYDNTLTLIENKHVYVMESIEEVTYVFNKLRAWIIMHKPLLKSYLHDVLVPKN